jgi:ParB family transcriptional regulator, chromosome partitioning protein
MESTHLTVQPILLARIRPNPKNPRKVKTDEAVDKKSRSLQANGQESAIKLRPLTPEERLADPDHDYELIDGELRYRGALKLGWTALDAIILNISAEEAQWKAVMSNEWEELHWLSRYEAIEDRLNSPSQPTQQQVADELGGDQQSVSRASKVLSLLNPSARQAIYANCVNQDEYQVPEVVVRRLTELGDPSLVEKALKVAIERQMTEKEAKKLVKWMKDGNNPEDYGQKADKATHNPDDPNAQYWETLPEQVKVTRGKKGYRVVMDLSPAEAVPVVYGAMSNWEHLKGLAGEGNDLRYRNALPQAHKDAVPVLKREKADKAKAEADRKAALEAKAAEKARKEAQRQAALKAKAQAKAKRQKPGEEALSGTGVASSSTPAYSAGTPRNDSNNNFLGKIGDFVQQKTGLTPDQIKQTAEGMLAKDAKQAVNYQIRKGMRNILKDLF